MTLYLVPDIDAAVAKLRHILCDDTEPQHAELWAIVGLTRDWCDPHGIARPTVYDQDEGAPPPHYATKADIYNWLHGTGEDAQDVTEPVEARENARPTETPPKAGPGSVTITDRPWPA